MNPNSERLSTLTAGYDAVSRLQAHMRLEDPSDLTALTAAFTLLDLKVVEEKKLAPKIETLKKAFKIKWKKPMGISSETDEKRIKSVTMALSDLRQAFFSAMRMENDSTALTERLKNERASYARIALQPSRDPNRLTASKVYDRLNELYAAACQEHEEDEVLDALAYRAASQVLTELVRVEGRYPDEEEWNSLIKEVREFVTHIPTDTYYGAVLADGFVRQELDRIRQRNTPKHARTPRQETKRSIIEPAPSTRSRVPARKASEERPLDMSEQLFRWSQGRELPLTN